MADRTSNFANAFETTLTVAMGATDTTATVDTTTGGPVAPCYLVIDPDDDAKREYIWFDGVFTGTTFVTSAIANRYLAGSAAGSGIVHDPGAKVRSVATAQAFEDLHDRVDGKAGTTHGHAAGDVTSGIFPLARGGTNASTAAGARTNLDVPSKADLTGHTGASNPHTGSASTADLAGHTGDDARHVNVQGYTLANTPADFPAGVTVFGATSNLPTAGSNAGVVWTTSTGNSSYVAQTFVEMFGGGVTWYGRRSSGSGTGWAGWRRLDNV